MMMKRPATICQIPATMHRGEIILVITHQKPKKTAARKSRVLIINGIINCIEVIT